MQAPLHYRRRLNLGLGVAIASLALITTSAALISEAAVPIAAPALSSNPPVEGIPDTAALAGPLADQKLVWHKCDFSLVHFSRPGTQETLENDPDTSCATIQVPQDWKKPSAKTTFDIEISRTKSPSNGKQGYRGAMLINPGGPGGSGLPWAPAMKLRSPKLAASYDLIGFDPRGVAKSANGITCALPPEGAPAPSAAQLCEGSPARTLINTEQTVYDMDFIRYLLGQKKISYLGYSYGTWLGGWFGKVFGPNIERMVLDSSTNVTKPSLSDGWTGPQQVAKQRRLEGFIIPWMARNSAEFNKRFGLNIPSDPDDVKMALLRGAVIDMTGSEPETDDPNTLAGYRFLADIDIAALNLACEVNMGGSQADFGRWAVVCFGDMITEGTKHDFPVVEPTIRPTRDGLVARGFLAAFQALHYIIHLPDDPRLAKVDKWITPASPVSTFEDVFGGPQPPYDAGTYDPFTSIRCSDGEWNQDPSYYTKLTRQLLTVRKAAWGTLTVDNVCLGWTTPLAMPQLDSAGSANFPQTLVIQDEFDTRTAYSGGVVTATQLPNTTGVFIDNESEHGVYPYGDTCVDPRVNDFLIHGKRSRLNTVCQARPLPLEKTPFEVGGVIQRDGSIIPSGGAKSGTPSRSSAVKLTASERLGESIVEELQSGIQAGVDDARWASLLGEARDVTPEARKKAIAALLADQQ